MKDITFRALAVTNEIDLNKIAIHCHIPKKYTWEQPLILRGDILSSILQKETDSLQQVLVFSFGSIVFVNHKNKDEITAFLKFIQTFEPDLELQHVDRYMDDYSLHIEEIESMELTDKYVIVAEYQFFYPELISTVLAKSVALEKIEEQLGDIHDGLEGMIDRLEKGKLRVGNKELARTTAKIVRHEYNTLAYIMILDKPDLTWTNSTASEFYDGMMDFFELNDRYKILKSKTDILYHILEGFSNISHSIRGLFVEWIVVILIVIEVALTVLQIVGWLPSH
ncbi:RMD1 family protein [Paenibacillus sp. CGMCC 1.16610]|uniref:RMD1 family protein n=2 Tax=Paenibacillus TaxID=44249 RepID=A0ABU6D8K9_9BACL|nr:MULTISPECIES: RMD1 family protein [Paenibacillus]MBA2941296.1 RMD1 family protein [Paenibacillus sp. CGMCC 1.16610]MCY9659725.1 RMD1 family protein [Paenibacillus anseongense]MEB4794096.1 RMD1 family protein [Paenibacillus chondroitinus]MVQ40116.1 RMD1 family protein [Paenibacillus anseongense]